MYNTAGKRLQSKCVYHFLYTVLENGTLKLIIEKIDLFLYKFAGNKDTKAIILQV